MRPQRFFRHLLQIGIDRRVNPKAFVHGAVPADGGDHLLADVIDRVGLSLRILPAADTTIFRLRAGALLAADKAEVAHPVERVIARLARAGAIGPGRQSVWALDQTGECRAFRQRHFTRRFAEITARRRFRSVQTAAEINPVQIELHDFLFAETFLDPSGQKNLEQLAAERSFLERKTVARQLLRNCAGALAHMAGREIFQRGADDPEQIVAVMLIKFCVLDGDDRVDEIGRQLVVRHCLAVLDVDLAKDFAVAIENHAGRFHLFELAQVERSGLRFEIGNKTGNVNCYDDGQHRNDANGNVKPRSEIPRWPKTIARRRPQICGSRSQTVEGLGRR